MPAVRHTDSPESAGSAHASPDYDVFVSHSSKDREAADAACRELESRGIRCWMAPRDIRPGANWGESILEAIGRVKVMVLLLSANANASPQVQREVERAVNKSVVIIPVRIENVMPSASLEYFLSAAHWLDAFVSPLEEHGRDLAAAVQGMLRGKPFVSSPGVAASIPPRRSLRTWIAPIAFALAVLAVAVLSFAAGGWWRRGHQDQAQQTPPVVAPVDSGVQSPAPFTPASPAPAVVAAPPPERPPPSLSDFAGSWEVMVVNIEDVAGNSSSYGPIRFTVGSDGSVRGKAALKMELRSGVPFIHPAPVVLDLEGRVDRSAWKSHDASGVFLDREDFSYRVAEIELTLSDGAVGRGLLAFSEGLPVVEHITFSKGEASGRMYATRLSAAAGPAPSGLRIDPLQSGDVVTDGAWLVWMRPGSGPDQAAKVAELDLATGELVMRINGRLERLQKRSEKWNPSRDAGPSVGDQGEEVWANATTEVRLSFQLVQADSENEFSRFAGQMRVAAGGETSVLMVEGETGA